MSNFDEINSFVFLFQLDYCGSVKNLDSIKGKPNYKFIQVSGFQKTTAILTLMPLVPNFANTKFCKKPEK